MGGGSWLRNATVGAHSDFCGVVLRGVTGPLYMGKMGSICHFPRALPASIWGHCSQILIFTSIWGTQTWVWQWHFSCCFSQHLVILGPPKHCKTRGKRKMTNRPCFTPPHGPPSHYPSRSLSLWGPTRAGGGGVFFPSSFMFVPKALDTTTPSLHRTP